MTFPYTDPDGYTLDIVPSTDREGRPVLELLVSDPADNTGWRSGSNVQIPEETLLAGVRDAARQAAGQAVCRHPEGYEGECPCVPGCACCRVTAADEQQSDACPSPESHNWGCGCATDQMPGRMLEEASRILHDAMEHGVKDPVVRQKLIGQLVAACHHMAELRAAVGQQPATDFTEARAAFMQIGQTPSLQGLRAELRIEGYPPLVGNYAGAGMRRIEPGVLSIEPRLLFAYADLDQADEASTP